MVQELKLKYRETKKENNHRNGVLVIFLFFIKVQSFAWRLLTAKIYLMGCKTGRLVTTRGKPLIIAKGDIIIEDRVVIWSLFCKTILSVHAGAKLTIGTRSRLNGVHIATKSEIRIGKDVRIAPYTLIMDSDFHDVEAHLSEGRCAPIIIEDNVWIASRATILKGVTIGKGSVVAAGAVVTKNVSPFTVVAGVPAIAIRVIKQHKGSS